MFTGLVSDVGRIAAVEGLAGLRRLTVESRYPTSALQLGASVMHAGCCLTIVAFGEREGGSWWVVEAIPETLSRTVLGEWTIGSRVNTELSLKAGDEMGGHIVAGHIDAMGQVVAMTQEGESWRIRIALPPDLIKFLAEKGSIAVDGVSLTIAAVGGDRRAEMKLESGLARYVQDMTEEYKGPWFEVTIIPHTLAVTTLGRLTVGDRVNLEVDLLARYVARMLEIRDDD